MKTTRFCLALLLSLLSLHAAIAQEPLGRSPKKARTPEDYRASTLKEISTRGALLTTEDGAVEGEKFLHGDLSPSRVRVSYRGAVRPIGQKKKELITAWANRYAGYPGHYTVPYTSEALFREAGVDHWLVVKKSDLPDLKRQFKKGAAVDLYLLRLGALKDGTDWEWVLLVEKFATPPR